MATIKISSKVEEAVWEDLKQLSHEYHQNISGLLTEAISDCIRRRRVLAVVHDHLKDSIRENENQDVFLPNNVIQSFFLAGLMENNTCDYYHFLPWIKKSVVSI